MNNDRLYLSLGRAISLKAGQDGICCNNIRMTGICTCCGNSYYSYRRGDRGRQNLAFFMMKDEK
ncbi:MAG: laccase domain-containing protein [Ruminococcus sp.]|uniref:laccase domain-containing protein n=1 Tax=Ruminococcus sp. TaxID=41978 RepID=UPI002A070C00|nr:laccase domain-containing protein [Ruminococcus sp.]